MSDGYGSSIRPWPLYHTEIFIHAGQGLAAKPGSGCDILMKNGEF
jgi:hypothetical protein